MDKDNISGVVKTPYTPQWQMRALIADNPMLLAVLTRFGISLGFGEATVAEVCASAGVHVPTFLAVANFISGFPASTAGVDIVQLISYLSNAHDYFLNYVAPRMRQLMLQAISPSAGARLSLALMKFFDEYIAEIRRHMNFEDEVVFAYVYSLLDGKTPMVDFNIDEFGKSHTPIHGKLAELKNLLVCHFTAEKGRVDMMNTLLFDIVTSERDLSTHYRLEDALFVPAVRHLMDSGASTKDEVARTSLSDNGDVQLTAREREIVANVARGLSNKEIADKLFLSVHTVATHRRNICAKLDLHSSSALAVYGIMHGLV